MLALGTVPLTQVVATDNESSHDMSVSVATEVRDCSLLRCGQLLAEAMWDHARSVDAVPS